METYELILLVAIGLSLCLFGYRIKKIAFFVIWFLIGYQLTSHFLPDILNLIPDISNQNLWHWLLPIAGGLLLSLIGFSIEKLCIGGICFALTIIITIKQFGTDMSTLAVGAVIGILLAGFAVMMMKPATIIATSVAGAYAIMLASFAIFTSLDQATYTIPIIAGATIIGALFQFTTTKRLL